MLDYKKIGLLLMKERKSLNLTQRELAEKLNITFQAVSRWEKGISIPSTEILSELSEIFNLSIDDILEGNSIRHKFSYEKSGVDIFKMDILNDELKDFFELSEFNPSFRGGIFDLNNYLAFEHPFIVSRVLEPGTKQRMAIEYGYIQNLVEDILYTLINDVLATGAIPLFITNTIISAQEDINFVKKVTSLFYEYSKKNNVKILKGHRSVKPSIIKTTGCLIDSSIIGIVDLKNLIDYKNVKQGDCILYIESNGLHHHGYSLVDELIREVPEIKKEKIGDLKFIDEIMMPPFCYYDCLKDLIDSKVLHCIANIAGFGIPRSLERIVPNDLSAHIDLSLIEIPEIFKILKKYLMVSDDEMINTFNCGVGYIVITSQENKLRVINHINSFYKCIEIGDIKKGKEKVCFHNKLYW